MNDNNKEINDPQVWMYVADCINPLLMIAFVIIYVVNNRFKKAFEIWIIALLIDILLASLLIIIRVAIAHKTGVI